MMAEEGKERGKVGKNGLGFRRRISFATFPKAGLLRPVQSIVTKDSAGRLAVFLLKVAALEAVRRGSSAKFPALWWGIQGISFLHFPPLNWLQRWVPLRHLLQSSQAFSKPLLFLSLATSATSFFQEQRSNLQLDDVEQRNDVPENEMFEENATVGTMAMWSVPTERENASEEEEEEEEGVEEEVNPHVKALGELNYELEKKGVLLPERLKDEELERFLIAAKWNVEKSIQMLRRTIRWRDCFYFLTPQELEKWSHLVFWHGRDKHLRPSLMIRLGIAFTSLKADERPRFVQAILSQVEYGILNLINVEDPRITVIMDCDGVQAVGFPAHMLRSCASLAQEHFPSRLAALFVVNIPPAFRVISQAIFQVLRPATREKIYAVGGIEGTVNLAEHQGGALYVPVFLGGSCTCSHCQRISHRRNNRIEELPIVDNVSIHHHEAENEMDSNDTDPLPTMTGLETFNHLVRMLIVGFLMLWVIVALSAGIHDPTQ